MRPAGNSFALWKAAFISQLRRRRLIANGPELPPDATRSNVAVKVST